MAKYALMNGDSVLWFSLSSTETEAQKWAGAYRAELFGKDDRSWKYYQTCGYSVISVSLIDRLLHRLNLL